MYFCVCFKVYFYEFVYKLFLLVSEDMELKKVNEERYKNELMKNGGVVKDKLGSGTCIDEAVKKRKIVDLEDEKVEEKRRADEQRMKDGEGGSGMEIQSSCLIIMFMYC
ncbi:hypothetical protein MtrunA17_Chr3g0101521 [Medicago truncatula]|uniref:Uncharacterized protein n=1 Tax=Medicago truncatula TaxID=3880 RepID=A0A396IRJ6_MEDTR|nr:hypothetical protein MtrunA17_Chr3g0101521 [Medicago truncatula]